MSSSWTMYGFMEVNMSLIETILFEALKSMIQEDDFEVEVVMSAYPLSGGGLGLCTLYSFLAKQILYLQFSS